MKKNSKIYVAGHRGLLGSAIVRQLKAKGFKNLVTATHDELDLTDEREVGDFFVEEAPDYVFLAAARVGGVCSNNNHEADFLRDNLLIQTNVIDAAHRCGVKKLLFMGSACVYPRQAEEPVREDSLLTGPLEKSNQWYAIAKIAGIKLCQAYWKQHGSCFVSCMPTNLYGPGDSYDKTSCHVLPAMLRRFHEARILRSAEVECWGTGAPTREFLYSDDCADACITIMRKYHDPEPINIGSGVPVSICELAQACAKTVGYRGSLAWDINKPDGTPRRALDGSKMHSLGWAPKYSLIEGLQPTYQDFVDRQLTPHADKIYDSHR